MLLLLMVSQRSWGVSVGIGGVLVFYLLAAKLTLCRVETRLHRPCRWRVRGYLRCCDYHLDLKHGPPSVVRVSGEWLPRVMWPRHDLASAIGPEPQPRSRGSAAIAPSARRWSAVDRTMMMLAFGSLVVAIMSFVRDLLAG